MRQALLLLILLTTTLQAQSLPDKAWAFTDTSVLGYDAETNPNRTGIVSVTLHRNAQTYYLDGVKIGKQHNYCHFEYDGSWHYQNFNYGSVYVALVSSDNTLDIYLDDVLIGMVPDWCVVQ